MPIRAKQTAVIAITTAFLASCATPPKPINLPVSSLTAKTESVEGSAIAFQANAGSCTDSGFQISPKLSDGKYGPAEKIKFSNSMFSLKSKGLKQKNFSSSSKQLYAKTMAPGDYAITRIWCTSSNGYQVTTYYTKPDRIDVFGEFTVDPGKTNYIGSLTVSKSYGGGGYPTFSIRDESTEGRTFFDEHYADKVGPMQTKLAKRKGPATGLSELSAIMKILEAAKARVDAKEAEDAETK